MVETPKRETAAAAALAQADAIADEIRGGTPLADAVAARMTGPEGQENEGAIEASNEEESEGKVQAAERGQGTWEQTGPSMMSRRQSGVPSEVLTTAFSLPRPDADGRSVGTSATADGGAAVVVVYAVQDGDADGLAEAVLAAEGRVLTAMLSRAEADAVVQSLLERADIQRESLAEDEDFQ
jgi:hypothetical protein